MDLRLRYGFRDTKLVQAKVRQIRKVLTRPWSIMEICGGQTHAIKKFGLDQLLPEEIELIHGPGCPVCVTSLELVDKALQIASLPDVIFTSYGDMLRVPGSSGDLFSVKARGGDVRVVYSPLDSLKIAQENPTKQVVFFAIGFETTAPANAMCVLQAEALKIENFSMLVSHVCVPPAIRAILSSPHNRVQGFLAAGHVCTVMGYWEYVPIASQFRVPIVVTGFEPLDILEGIYRVVLQLERGTHEVENAYSRVVTYEGNIPAQKVISQVFEVCDRTWRGIGVIPRSGWKLRDTYARFDAERRFETQSVEGQESPLCISGLILQGLKKPYECAAFGTLCTPQNPLGATMVSSEGACAAYYQYSRHAGSSERSHV
ncbi:MAG: hydrogenase formation protein HypD [Anaerolineales bacterium]|nr:hydrogenase formation protein HypD [Anaerolineales bacterium]MCS7247074.1 hydrogenase formation protein HypD [Anaerolineales bacterium]MDW8160885.1 hydrogenase formation protein HypD [Anaerolineales bacterium]MDW8447819.1 hydrogenase formation protein HypD [Anaerolineales bacterium]